jgi:ferredoxin
MVRIYIRIGSTKKEIMTIPVIEQKLCTGCGDCVEICEADAIRIVGEKVRIDYNRCYNSKGSNCRACADVCPRGAIKLVD